MRWRLVLLSAAASFLVLGSGPNLAQTLPTSQPGLIDIDIEDVKPGHAADHEANEAGWAAAYEKAKVPYSYLAMTSITGRAQVWYIASFASHADLGKSMKFTSENKELAAELGRFARLDAEHVENVRSVQVRARPDLSYGTFPDIATQRFWEITTFRLRPGADDEFAAAAKAYGASAARNSPKTSYRTYEVAAGLPGPTYLIFSSVADFAEFDGMASSQAATMKGLNPAEQEAMDKVWPGVISMETQRFELSPRMSYVPADVRAKDPKFWTTTPD